MRAGLVVAPGEVRCIEAAPPSAGPAAVVVRTRVAALCGSDLHAVYLPLEGEPFPLPPGAPGHEAVGVVVDPGAGPFAPGQRVLTAPVLPGAACFAELQAVAATSCLALGDEIDDDDAVLAQPLGTVIFALRPLLAERVPESAAVIGQGAIGLFFTRLLARAGVERIVAAEPIAARRRLARRFGARAAAAPGARFAEALAEVAGSGGAELVIEASGTDAGRIAAIEAVAMDGRVLFFGLPEGGRMDGFPYALFFRRRVRARATYGSQHEADLASYREALALLASGAVPAAALNGRRFPIERIDAAFAAAENAKETLIKALVHFD